MISKTLRVHTYNTYEVKLVESQREACELLDIVSGDVKLDVIGVESFEQNERKMEEAKNEGAVFDFCDLERTNILFESIAG